MIFQGKYKITFRTNTEYEETIKEARKTAKRMQAGNDENYTIWKWDSGIGDHGEYVPHE